MDTNTLLSKLNHAAPGAVLEKQRFGRSETHSVWIDVKAVRKVAEAVSGDQALDWLENLSVSQVGEALVLTYFLRAPRPAEGAPSALVLRASSEPKAPDQPVDVATVRDFWPMAAAFENEAAELFGIRFLDANNQPIESITRILPEGWTGFPLRKTGEATK